MRVLLDCLPCCFSRMPWRPYHIIAIIFSVDLYSASRLIWSEWQRFIWAPIACHQLLSTARLLLLLLLLLLYGRYCFHRNKLLLKCWRPFIIVSSEHAISVALLPCLFLKQYLFSLFFLPFVFTTLVLQFPLHFHNLSLSKHDVVGWFGVYGHSGFIRYKWI